MASECQYLVCAHDSGSLWLWRARLWGAQMAPHSKCFRHGLAESALIQFLPSPGPEGATIKYARVIGGLPGCESALVGCVDGAVLQVFLAHPQPVHLLQHSCAIR